MKEQKSKLELGKLVITPYKRPLEIPGTISDPELYVALCAMKLNLEPLFDQTTKKKKRIESLKSLRTICNERIRSLIDQEIARLSEPSRTPKNLVDADDTLTPEEAKRVRKAEGQMRAGKGIPWEEVKKKLKL